VYHVLLGCFVQTGERTYPTAYINGRAGQCYRSGSSRVGKCYETCAKKGTKKPILVTKVLESGQPGVNAPSCPR
jgi:hypothetical protein